jgi:hypothetical protein
METATTAGAGAALTAPLWMQAITPYAQFAIMVMGGCWLAMQMYYKFKNERKKARDQES